MPNHDSDGFRQPTRRQFLAHAALAGVGAGSGLAAFRLGAAENEESVRTRIEGALPKRASTPLKPRKLLIFDSNVNYGGHASIPTANLAFTLMGEKTGAFTTTVSHDPEVFQPQNLRQFDAVFFNNNVGNLFETPALRQSLVDFVYGGGGLMGVHGATVAFTKWPGAMEDWPEFGIMLGARGANHRISTERVLSKLDDPTHPVNRVFGGQGFEYRDEFFRVYEPYSRQRVRVLFSINVAETDMNQGQGYGQINRPDQDYALAWVHAYGRGRVFYCTIAHNPYVFWDPKMLQFYLDATQFVLGDLPAPTIPSGRLTPALTAQEQLGWRLGWAETRPAAPTLTKSIEQAARDGLLFLEARDSQLLQAGAPVVFDHHLDDEQRRQLRLQLDAAGVRLLAYQVTRTPAALDDWRAIFAFAHKMGVETLIARPAPESLPALDALCQEYEISLALPEVISDTAEPPSRTADLLQFCRGRSRWVGICGCVGAWLRAGLSAPEGLSLCGQRLLMARLGDLNQLGAEGRKVKLGSGAGRIGEFLRALPQQGIKPGLLTIASSEDADFFNQTSVALAKGGRP